MTSALLVATVKFESLEYQACGFWNGRWHFLITEALHDSLEWTWVTPYKLEMASKMPKITR
jgi:hypothetical protein